MGVCATPFPHWWFRRSKKDNDPPFTNPITSWILTTRPKMLKPNLFDSNWWYFIHTSSNPNVRLGATITNFSVQRGRYPNMIRQPSPGGHDVALSSHHVDLGSNLIPFVSCNNPPFTDQRTCWSLPTWPNYLSPSAVSREFYSITKEEAFFGGQSYIAH